MKGSFNKLRLGIVFAVALSFVSCALIESGTAYAQQSSSPNYTVNEVFFGSGGELDASSTNYRSKQSAGELAVGAIRSTLYSAQAGFNTDRTPYIAMATITTHVDVGVLDAGRPNVGESQFWVKAYLADGYVVQSYGGPPSNGGHTLATAATPFASVPGTEQFGFNLAANNTLAGAMTGTPLTSVSSFGGSPQQFPDYTPDPFGFGEVDPDYQTANSFRYVDGDVVAFSPRSSSDTLYTISYLFNASPTTPAGVYTMNHVLVSTATY